MSQDPSDSECSALTNFFVSLVCKYVNLKEPYNQNIKEWFTTIIFFKKEDRLYMKSSIPEAKFAKGVFQIQSPISVVNFSNNISKTQIRVNEWKKYLYSTFRTLQPLTSNHASSDHKSRCKTTYQKFAQIILVPHAKLFYYKGSTIFCRGRGDTMLYLQIFSHF